MQRQARENIRTYVSSRIIWEFEKAVTTLDVVNRKVWELSSQTEDKRERIAALELIKDANHERLDLLTHQDMLRECLIAEDKKNRKIQQLEAKAKSLTKTTISRHTHEEIKRNDTTPEIEQTTNYNVEWVCR